MKGIFSPSILVDGELSLRSLKCVLSPWVQVEGRGVVQSYLASTLGGCLAASGLSTLSGGTSSHGVLTTHTVSEDELHSAKHASATKIQWMYD